jgi:hypothetical protein
VRYRLIVNSSDAAKAGLGFVSVFSHHVVAAFQDGTWFRSCRISSDGACRSPC